MPPADPKKRFVSLAFPVAYFDRIARAAQRRGLNPAAFLRLIIADHLNASEKSEE
jgi:hypothetical protein